MRNIHPPEMRVELASISAFRLGPDFIRLGENADPFPQTVANNRALVAFVTDFVPCFMGFSTVSFPL